MPASAIAAAARRLDGRVSGRVLTSSDVGYEDARCVWNSMVDKRPAVILRAAEVADVVIGIDFARTNGLELAIRCGGHNVAGRSTVEGGLVLDLGAMTAVTVEPGPGLVRVQGGARLCHVDAATVPHGLAVPIGVVSQTGIAGLTLGGGLGWLTRKHGLAADNLVAATLVTATGQVITTRDDAELLWALRGGGGNFGVVTELVMRAHPLRRDPFTATFSYGADRWPAAWRAFAEWTAALPDDMTAITTTLTPWPELEMGQEPVLLVGCAWASEDAAGFTAEMDRLRLMCPPDAEQVGPLDWVQWQSAFDGAMPKGVRSYWRNTSFDRIDDEVQAVLIERGKQGLIGAVFDVHHLGGQFAGYGQEHSPFPGRDAGFWLNTYSFWRDPGIDEQMIGFTRGMSSDMEPLSSGAQYVNFQGEEQDGHRLLDARTVFGPGVFDRLAAVKRRLDPENRFHLNLNIPPA